MASNKTEPNWDEAETTYDDPNSIISQVEALFDGYLISGLVILLAGSILNLWFLVAMVSSQTIRSRLRNKIICNTLLLSLLDCLLVLPMEKISFWHLIRGHYFTCVYYAAITNLDQIQDFMENWIMVMLSVIFIAQIQDVDPSRTFSPRTITLATSALLVLPWVASLIIVPVVFNTINIRYNGTDSTCLNIMLSDTAVFKSVDTAVPICLAVILVSVAAWLRHRRFSQGYSLDSAGSVLMGSGAEIDSAHVYGVAVAVSLVCDFLYMFNLIIVGAYVEMALSFIAWYRLELISKIMSESRVVLMPIVWLLFPDIRKQIRTWRPWRCQSPSVDLRVTYR